MRYYLGVDAGATKTYALVGDETGRLLSLGKGGPGNHQSPGGLVRAMDGIAAAVAAALAGAGLTPAAVSHAAFCLAGADLPCDYACLTGAIKARWPDLPFTVMNDSFAGLRAGLTGSWGVVSICGTGTNQAGIGKDGRRLQVGGLGGIFGDYGGGADLGREAVKAVFLGAEQRGPATSLTGPVLRALEADDVDTLRERLYRGEIERSRIFALAPLVFAAANEGDAVAQEILIHMGTRLGQSVGGVIRQLGLTQEAVEVVMAGSIWKGDNPLLVDAFRLAVHRVAPRVRLVRPRFEPVVGAWLLALESGGGTASEAVYRNLEATMPADLPIWNETRKGACV
jgi:N-acetylglucosamine kinase-like BadF-type ATPase